MSLIVYLLFLFISGVVAQNEWGVNYNSKSICVQKGSVVTMSCTYTYPKGHSVQKAFWTKGRPEGGSEPPDLLEDPDYRSRVQYLSDKQHDCTFRLSDVRETDQRKYYFTFITNGGKWYGADGVDLSVTDLQVEVPERVIEGERVTLTCKTTCSLTVRPTFTWYRDGHRLSSSTDQLHLQSVSREDVRYRCAVLGLNSPEVTLNVRYGPKSVSVSISPTGYIVEGSSVTLTCSSDANPPVECTWFKGTSSVVKGEIYTMHNIRSVDGGEYKCKCSNEHGEKDSEAVTLSVLYPPKNVSVSISPSGYILEGSSVTLTCSSSDANPPVQNYTWFKGTSLVATGETYTVKKISSVGGGVYICKGSNGYIEKDSEAVTLNVLYPPKNVSVSISPSGYIVEGSSVSLTCSSSDANPPVKTYTWFNGTSLVATGETYTVKKISSVDGGEYKCISSNEHGEKDSESVTLNVLYPPKNVSVSISPSGYIVEGSSATLTCSSDGNPPVQNYTWFKEGGDSPVGSGHSYSAVQSGSYYCVAQNEYGPQKSAAVTVTVTVKGAGSAVLYAVIGVIVGCLCVIIAVFCVRKKRRGILAANQIQENLYSSMKVRSTARDTPPDPDPDDVLYASVVSRGVTNPRNAESSAVTASGDDEEVQYASVHPRRDRVVEKTEGDDVQYASVRFTRTGAANRSDACRPEDNFSVIYSSVK